MKPYWTAIRQHLAHGYHEWIHSSDLRWRFYRMMVLAIFLRVLVMPFFCHLDFFSEYRRIYFQLSQFNIFPGARFVVTLVEMINFILALPFLRDVQSMFFLADAAHTTASHQDFFVFVKHPGIFRTLFLLKIGYLIFDMAAGRLLFRYMGANTRGLIAAGVWFFNPVTIFSFYIFGRYESIALFFLLLAIYAHRQNRPLLSALAFGLCVWAREVFVLILPFYLTAIWIDSGIRWKHKFAGTAIQLLIFSFVLNWTPALLGFRSVLDGAYEAMSGQGQIRQIIAFNIGWYYPLIVGYGLSFLYLISGRGPLHERMIRSFLAFFLVFFIFSIHSIHYVAWLFPVLCLFVADSRRVFIATIAFVLSWIAYWTVATDLGVFTPWLAAPASLHLLNLPNIPVLLKEVLPNYTALQVGDLVAIFKSLNIACLIYIGWSVFFDRTSPSQSSIPEKP